MTTVPSCPMGSPVGALPLNTTIPLDSRLCWTQDMPCITDCCSALGGTIAESCGLDQCLGSYAQLDWRDCVKDWYLNNEIDLEDKWFSCYPRSPGTTSAVGLDISAAPHRVNRRGLVAVVLLAVAIVTV